MRLGYSVLIAIISLSSCGKDTCSTPQIRPVDETRLCYLPPVQGMGLVACEERPESKSVAAVCVVDSSGKLYVLFVRGGTTLRTNGWTSSGTVDIPSTLSQTDADRCTRALAKLPLPSPETNCM
jgi:hypothetical protein